MEQTEQKTRLCDTCLFSRVIVSENGIHCICCLSTKSAMNCLLGIKPRYSRCVWREEGKGNG